MRRSDAMKRLDKKSRNKLRAILSNEDANAINSIAQLRTKLGKDQLAALEVILNSSTLFKAVRISTPFPKKPSFRDCLQSHREVALEELLSIIEKRAIEFRERLIRIAESFHQIDIAYAANDIKSCRQLICASIELDGWSHAILRRIVLIRENSPVGFWTTCSAFGSVEACHDSFLEDCQAAKCTWFTCSATRKALAVIVKLGFMPVLEGKNEPSTT